MNYTIFLILFLSSSYISVLDWNYQFIHRFIIWNIGQGSWSTVVEPNYCIHFDLGGEHPPDKEKLFLACGGKQQIIILSHYDRDHTNFLFWYYKLIQGTQRSLKNNFCAFGYPAMLPDATKKLYTNSSLSKKSTQIFYQKLIMTIPLCPQAQIQNVKNLYFPTSTSMLGSRIKYNKLSSVKITSNDLSRVFQWKNILIPGDSPIKQERIWGHNSDTRSQILILGHHGSRTSTSDTLLNHLPNLKFAIASARKSVYGHPHKEVLQRLKTHHIPLLRTEVWGNIILER
jgi:competence protein ComEC